MWPSLRVVEACCCWPSVLDCYIPQGWVCSCLGQPLGIRVDMTACDRIECTGELSPGSMAPLQNGLMLFFLHKNDPIEAGHFHLHYVSHVHVKLILV